MVSSGLWEFTHDRPIVSRQQYPQGINPCKGFLLFLSKIGFPMRLSSLRSHELLRCARFSSIPAASTTSSAPADTS